MNESTGQAATEREFTTQSKNFEKPGSLFRDTEILDWISANIPVPTGAQILDVAGGTGLTGRHLIRDGATLVVVDSTDAMLLAGLRSVQEAGRRDVAFVRGDATDLPFPDSQFDVVLSRFALHHIGQPELAVAEMGRVCRAGGSVAVIDMVAGGARHDELERLRDPSHVSALDEGRIVELVGRTAGQPSRRFSEREHAMRVESWLEQSGTPEPAARTLRAAFTDEADGGRPTGLRAARDESGELTITQRWILAGS